MQKYIAQTLHKFDSKYTTWWLVECGDKNLKVPLTILKMILKFTECILGFEITKGLFEELMRIEPQNRMAPVRGLVTATKYGYQFTTF